MKVLLCSQNPLDPGLGAPKVLIELAAEMEKLGHRCRLVSDTEICPSIHQYRGVHRALKFAFALARFLEAHAGEYDVADFDQIYLPFSRDRLPRSCLLVARSVLLQHHFTVTRIPRIPGLRGAVGTIVKGPFRKAETRFYVQLATRTFSQADLINVSNEDDQRLLVGQGFDPGKIVTIPFGLTSERLASFSAVQPPAPPRAAFVGTFDARKGGRDLPIIARRIADAVPGGRLRLIGVRRDPGHVLRHFPAQVRPNVEIIPTFEPDTLPELLRDCSVGVFPSYVEGFGFGVLEMLAASLPVIAYDAPGPPMMLPPEYLAPRGAAHELASKVIALLRDRERLAAARRWARKRASDFTWASAAKITSDVYTERLSRLRASS